MATYTDNYQLTKPTMAETADIRTINGNMDTIDDILHASQISLADAYDSTQTYNTDDVVMYEFLMYKCLEDNVTGTWDATKWERTVASSSGASGTEVVPNPQGTPTADLNTIGIGGDIFNIAGSGGGGGNVYGAFIDTNRVIKANTSVASGTTDTYTATEDCAIHIMFVGSTTASRAYIDGVEVETHYASGVAYVTHVLYIRRGQVFSLSSGDNSTNYTVYGLTFGTQNIFTPQIYSTEERCVGVWIDNKPLYQKTIEFTNVSKSGTVSFGIANVEMIRLVNGKASASSPINYVHGSAPTNNVGGFFNISPADTGWSFRCGNDAPSTISGDITVLYTKTTDVAGSGSYNTLGVPTHHYSTEEQVVGTWIDGKPLYEKTYTVSFVVPSGGTWFSTGIALTDVENLIDTQCRQSIAKWNVISGLNNGGILVLINPTGGSLTVENVTIQYTKITD